jgi:RNA polymerase sigma-70 factor (ECF subfamily)
MGRRTPRIVVRARPSRTVSENPTDPVHDQLLAGARRGDAAALQQLLCRHVERLRAYVRLHSNAELRARESCSDLVQSVCRECLEDLPSFRFDNEPAFRKWLFQKAMAKLVDRDRYWHAERRDARRERDATSQHGPATSTSPSDLAMRNEELAALEACFAQLPAEYRQVIVATRLLGQSHAELAAELGRNEGAVRMLLHRAMAKLARLLDERGAAGER